MNIYVGNLSHTVSESDLEAEFAAYGAVSKVSVITDRETGRPRGFAFVEMASDAEAQSAIERLNGKDIAGRNVTVNEARPRESRPRDGGGRGHRH